MREKLNHMIKHNLSIKTLEISNIYDKLSHNNPLNILNKGYSIIKNDDNHVLKSKSDLIENTYINIIFKDGEVKGEFSPVKEWWITMAKKAEKYEDNLEKLRDIVNVMDQNELSLEESMKKYEEGINLCNKLYKALKSYEEKILILNEDKEEEFKEIWVLWIIIRNILKSI